uniref:Uncharacterized protein n=1 Tax=Panagrolaimus davidi TaxID=227884 RepID=A0A914QH32_9BILA
MRCGKCSGKSEKCPTKLESGGMRKVYLQRGMLCVCDSQESVCLRCGICQICAESVNLKRYREDEKGSDEAIKISAVPATITVTQGGQLSPARLVLQGDIKVSTVSCGNYHTILLCADRSVYTFGSNCHGQLGTGDTEKRSGAFKLNLPSNIQIVQAIAGANHCILRTLDGQILTFGAFKNGQLIRAAPSNCPPEKKWFTEPTFVEGYGQSSGIIASWISAVGDRTIIQTQKQIFTKQMLNDARVTARKDCLIILPPATFHWIHIIRFFGHLMMKHFE